jgi:hypothetical protein
MTLIGVDGCHGDSDTKTNPVEKMALLSIYHVSVIGYKFVSKVYPVTIGISDELQVVRGNLFVRRGNLS